METNHVIKVALTIFTILYIISPLDACPGPIDDVLVLILDLAGRAALNRRNNGQ